MLFQAPTSGEPMGILTWKYTKVTYMIPTFPTAFVIYIKMSVHLMTLLLFNCLF